VSIHANPPASDSGCCPSAVQHAPKLASALRAAEFITSIGHHSRCLVAGIASAINRSAQRARIGAAARFFALVPVNAAMCSANPGSGVRRLRLVLGRLMPHLQFQDNLSGDAVQIQRGTPGTIRLSCERKTLASCKMCMVHDWLHLRCRNTLRFQSTLLANPRLFPVSQAWTSSAQLPLIQRVAYRLCLARIGSDGRGEKRKASPASFPVRRARID
jgi:hypothetical protein